MWFGLRKRSGRSVVLVCAFRAARYSARDMGSPTDSHSAPSSWDAGDMGCGELVIELRSRLRELAPGALLRLVARDPGAVEDIPAWCGLTGHALVEAAHPVYLIRRKEN